MILILESYGCVLVHYVSSFGVSNWRTLTSHVCALSQSMLTFILSLVNCFYPSSFEIRYSSCLLNCSGNLVFDKEREAAKCRE